MSQSKLFVNMIQRPLLVAVVATFAAACATHEPPRSESVSWVGPAGPAGPAGATGAQGATGNTGAPGYAVVGPAGAAGPTTA
jgi:hypothetical protein